MQPARIGVIVALDAEARTLYPGDLPHQSVIHIHSHLCMVVAGMGPVAARAAAAQLLQAGATGLLSWGTAGGLDPTCQAGDLLLPEQVFWADARWPTDVTWRNHIQDHVARNMRAGGLCSVSTPCASVQAKSDLWADFPEAQAVDMESGAVAERAAQAGIPFVVVRSVVDPANQSLPGTATGSVDHYGRPQMLRLLRGLLRQPGDLPALMRLGKQMQAALQSLRLVQPMLLSGQAA